MDKEGREQSYWNPLTGSQLVTAGPGVVQPGCHSYKMGMMEGLFFSPPLSVVPLTHLYSSPCSHLISLSSVSHGSISIAFSDQFSCAAGLV